VEGVSQEEFVELPVERHGSFDLRADIRAEVRRLGGREQCLEVGEDRRGNGHSCAAK